MPEPTGTVLELEEIISRYTTYFIFFDIVFFAFLIAGVILLIHFAKSKKKLKESNEYLLFTIQGQEEECGRIARELHDTVAQNLRYCKALCEKPEAEKNLPQIAGCLSKSLAEVRSMSYNLAPPDITKNDFLLCVKNLCEEFAENFDTTLRLSILENTYASFLTKNEILNLYRIVQEALTNITKHAQASEIVILIRNANGEEEKGLYIFISDDGKGFDTEKIDAFTKLTFESQFQELSPGGAVSYVEVPNMENNIPAVMTLLKHIYNNIMYAELNTKSDYCQKCGYTGEIQIEKNTDGKLVWACPNCGNHDQNTMNVARRTCGYIGTQYWNQGRTQEIKERVLHL